MTTPLQLELLDDCASTLFGLQVRPPTRCQRCGTDLAVIDDTAGPHARMSEETWS